jgi:NTP pyrophosphatase (non-canonical NTP hydrolase)
MTYPLVYTLSAYQRHARTFAQYDEQNGVPYNSLKLASEAGEVAGKIAKNMGHGLHWQQEDMLSELGDCLWHLSMLAAELGFSLEEVANANLLKLAGRVERGTLVGNGDKR